MAQPEAAGRSGRVSRQPGVSVIDRAASLISASNSMPSQTEPRKDLWPSREQQLLLEAALCPGERGIAAFSEWRARVTPEHEFDWNVFRLLPLVYHNLHGQGVRDPLMARLRGVYRRAWCENHRLFHAAAPVIERLAAKGCELLLLKGAPLVLSYYRNHALRPMADIDVVVHGHQLQAAIEVLRGQGYYGAREVTSDLLRFMHAVQFVHPDGGQIDLHWHVLFEAAGEQADREFWAATEAAEFNGTSVRQPDPTSLLLQVIVHGVRSNEETPIRWIPDALTILRTRSGAIDWHRLLDFAGAYRLTYRLALGLRYLAETFQAPIPAFVLPALGRRQSLLERVENTVMLADSARFSRSALGTQWVSFTEYCRYARRGGPLAFLNGYTEYLRFRLNLEGRRELVPYLVRSLGRKLRNGADHGVP